MSDFKREVWIVTGCDGVILYKGDTFTDCFHKALDWMKESDFEEMFDKGVIAIKISKVIRRPFKILREVEITIHDEIKRKEIEKNASTEDHSCDNLFKEW